MPDGADRRYLTDDTTPPAKVWRFRDVPLQVDLGQDTESIVDVDVEVMFEPGYGTAPVVRLRSRTSGPWTPQTLAEGPYR